MGNMNGKNTSATEKKGQVLMHSNCLYATHTITLASSVCDAMSVMLLRKTTMLDLITWHDVKIATTTTTKNMEHQTLILYMTTCTHSNGFISLQDVLSFKTLILVWRKQSGYCLDILRTRWKRAQVWQQNWEIHILMYSSADKQFNIAH